MLTPTPEREQLRAVVRELLDTHSTEADVRTFLDARQGFDTDTWKVMTEQVGIAALAIPEEYGGAGFGFGELAVVMEECGRALACVPLLSTCVLAAHAILLSGDESAARTYLPGIADGSTIATVALLDDTDRLAADDVRTLARRSDDGWSITGTKTFVIDGADARLLLVPARTEAGISLFVVESHILGAQADGVYAEPLAALDQTRNLATLTFDAVPATLVGTDGHGWTYIEAVLDVGAAGLAAEQVGAAARVLETTVEYAKVREQFGRPIGSFQAIKHKLADMLVELESARSAAYYACGAVESGAHDLPLAASIAKAYCSDAFYHIAAESIQIHGGIGFTWEHPAHLYFKRARSSQTLLGSTGHHRERVAQLAGL